ncbi:MAG TPA: HDOD domain-containing protein [Verrucomicrobiae bacterium]
MDKIQKLLDRVEVLPLSPALLPKLLPKLSDVDTNFDEVVEIIAYDPALTSKLLHICNSAFFGQETEVVSVAEAVSRVGYQAVYLLVAMINGSVCFPMPSPAGVDAPKLWRHSIKTAFNSKFVAESAGLDGNLLFTAGLLHDVGKIILGQEMTPEMAASVNHRSTAASLERERALFHCTHADVGATLLERWNLPAQLGIAVRHHHEPKGAKGLEHLANCVALGNWVAHSHDHPEILELAEFKSTLASLGLNRDHLARWSERLRDHQSLVSGMSRLPL